LPPPAPERGSTRLLLLAPAAIGGAIVWMATGPYGPGLSPDSVQFLAAAKSLAAGHGWQRVEGTPFVEWAPLFPAWLALGARLGVVAPLALARLTGAMAAAGVAWATGLWTARATGSRAAALGAALVTATSFPLFHVAAHVWSDAPFLFLAVLGVLALGDTTRTRTGLVVAALFAALACLTRYLGVTLVAAGTLALVMDRRPKHAAAYAALAGAPLALWLTRNALVTGTATGLREPPGYTWGENLLGLAHGAADPLLRWNWPGAIKIALVIVVALLAWLVVRRAPPRREAGPLALFVIFYALAVVIVSSLWGTDRVDIRFALPVAVALVAGAFVAAAHTKTRAARVGIALLVALWLGRSVERDLRTIALYRQSGVPGFEDAHWRASPTLGRLRAEPPSPPLYSNAPEIAWLALETPVRLSPRAHLFYDETVRVNDLDAFVADVRQAQHATLIWFHEVERRSLVPRDSLARRVALRPVAELPDGAIDEVSP
jgi:hypothetical protein